MKKQLLSALILFSAFLASSCTENTVGTEKLAADAFDKEKFYNQLSTVPFYISKAYRVVGNDTIDVLADPVMIVYRDAAFLTFVMGSPTDNGGYINFYGGSVWGNSPYPAPARAFSTNMRFSRPTSMRFEWDSNKKTVVITSSGSDEAFRLVPPGKSAYLDTSRFYFNYDMAAAESGADQRMIWIYDDFTIEMKPMYIFYRDPNSASWERGIVVF